MSSSVTSEADSAAEVHSSPLAELNPALLYAVLQLRVDVFVVEQECAYRELDGLDLRSDTVHYWVELNSEAVATARTLRDGEDVRIGRVATAPAHRGRGYARCIMQAAIRDLGEVDIRLEAQTHLYDWYAGFGFTRAGADYVEDGIPHVPMRRATGMRSLSPAQH